jgi:cysteine desulfurase
MTTYLDANASETIRPKARATIEAAWRLPGNPASVHGPGRAARAMLEEARVRIAGFVGAQPKHVVFTSGGTEADAMAIHALGYNRRQLIGATEHDAVRSAAREAGILPVLPDGTLDLAALEAALAEGPPALVCAMLANNETGVIHPIPAIAALCRAHGALLHVDAVQALGRIPVDLAALGADSLAISAHKIGGPKGIGALIFARDFPTRPLIGGGGQEKNWRGGTQNLPGAAGFAAALAMNPPEHAVWRDEIAAAAQECGAIAAGLDAPRLPNTLCLILPGVRADLQLISLDLAGYAVSAGAACSSGKVAKSHVLEAMGLAAQAGNAIRVSLSWATTHEEITGFIAAYRDMATKLLRQAHLRKAAS